MGNAMTGGGRKTVKSTDRSGDHRENAAAATMDELTRDVERLKAAMDERDRTIEQLSRTVDDIRVSGEPNVFSRRPF